MPYYKRRLKEKKLSNNKEKEWISVLKQIENSTSELLGNRFFFCEFMSIIQANPQLPENNYFIVWIWENYLYNAAIGVRRLVDRDERCVSLFLLLKNQIRSHL